MAAGKAVRFVLLGQSSLRGALDRDSSRTAMGMTRTAGTCLNSAFPERAGVSVGAEGANRGQQRPGLARANGRRTDVEDCAKRSWRSRGPSPD